MISKVNSNLNTNSNIRSSVHRETGFVEKRNVAVPFCEKFEKNVNNERLREPANVNFCGLSATPSKMEKLYKNPKTHKVLKFIEEQQLIFGAAYAILLTCFLRPASIMALPSDKKNKDDKIYASAHSVASGIIGFALSNVLFYPLNEGVNRLKKNPDKFFKDAKWDKLKNENIRKVGMTYLERLPDVVFAIPKGILTVALIPLILKHGFGYEKKKAEPKAKTIPLSENYQLLNFKSATDKNSIVSDNVAGGAK